MKRALRIGVVIESFHARYTLTQKRLKIIVSSDEAMIKSQKYAKERIRMSNRDMYLGRDDKPRGDARTQSVNDVGTATHE